MLSLNYFISYHFKIYLLKIKYTKMYFNTNNVLYLNILFDVSLYDYLFLFYKLYSVHAKQALNIWSILTFY